MKKKKKRITLKRTKKLCGFLSLVKGKEKSRDLSAERLTPRWMCGEWKTCPEPARDLEQGVVRVLRTIWPESPDLW